MKFNIPVILRHVTLTTPTWGTVCHHKTNRPTSRANSCTNLTILFLAIPEKIKF